MQEGDRKDVNMAFGVLQVCWAIVRGHVNMLDPETLWEVMTYCVMIDDMIVEDEDDGVCNVDFENPREQAHLPPTSRSVGASTTSQ